MTPDRRMTIVTAVACVLVSTVLFPVFISSLWFGAAIGAAGVAAATGALTRLRPLPVPVCLAAGFAGLLLYLNLIFESRYALLAVIPTPGSVARLWNLAVAGLTEANRYAPPVPNVPGLLLLAAGGVGITAVVTDLIAVRLRSAALAGLPLLVLFSVPVMMNASHNPLANGLVFCLGGAGYLAMLSADGRERIRVWGRLVSLWRTGPRYPGASRGPGPGIRDLTRGPDTRALAAAGRRVGLASIVLALCAPVLLPGLHPSKLFSSGPGIGGDGSGGGSVPLSLPGALSQTVAQLHESRQTTVFTYRTSASAAMQGSDAEYFRQYVFNTLTGAGWVVSNYTAGSSDISKLPAPQGLATTTPTRTVTTTVTASASFPGSAPAFLPLPYPATQIRAPGRWLADPDLMVYSPSDSIAGRAYSVTSLMVDPSQAQLQQAPGLTPAPGLAADVRLPSSYQAKTLKQLAEASTSGQYTEFGKVYKLANWLSGAQFGYSLSAPTFTDAAGLVSFLTKAKIGFCVQYAYAMTVLTRLLGIPARFVVGYTAGTRLKDGSYAVRNTDAHAWTEVYFPTLGWIRFEPTPAGQGTANPPNYMIPASSRGQSGSAPPILPETSPSSGVTTPSVPVLGHSRQLTGEEAAPTVTAGRARTPWTAVALAVIAAIVLASGLIAVIVPGFAPAQRVPGPRSGRTAGGRRRRGPRLPAAAALTAAAALVALSLYRLLSRTSGLNLRAGWATVGIAFGAAAVLVLTAPAALRLIRRRWRWVRADDDASRAHAAWLELHDDLGDYGVAIRPSEPPRALAARITTGLPEPAADAVRRLALAEERACYAARPAESRYLGRDAATARRGLAATAGRGLRWRAALFPASVLIALADTAVRVPEHAAALRPRHRAHDRARDSAAR